MTDALRSLYGLDRTLSPSNHDVLSVPDPSKTIRRTSIPAEYKETRTCGYNEFTLCYYEFTIALRYNHGFSINRNDEFLISYNEFTINYYIFTVDYYGFTINYDGFTID